jgi:proteasome lid subunit RPN8/RPN11
MNVVVPSSLQQRIIEEMIASYPNEGGGFLLGTLDASGTVRIADVTRVENTYATEEQYHRYAMTPQDWARLEDLAEASGLSLVGYYHSHPDSPAIPSVFDRDHALPNFVYIITSVQQREAREMRVWQLDADRTRFSEETLVIEPA